LLKLKNLAERFLFQLKINDLEMINNKLDKKGNCKGLKKNKKNKYISGS